MIELNKTHWDVAVIGAGPAGGVAAAILAVRRQRVLLIDRSPFPREKTCGGCLNAVAAGLLVQAGLGAVLRGALRLDRVAWHVKAQSLELPIPSGVAILRSELDMAITSAAIARGCTFLSGTSAALLPGGDADVHRTLRLHNAREALTITASSVLACDGIAGTSLATEPWSKWHVHRRSWIGVSTTCDRWPGELSAGTIHMHVGSGGYVGLVRMSGGQIHLAAALDPAAARVAAGPAILVEKILRSCGRTLPCDLPDHHWRGVGELTRRRHAIGGHRVLAVGDACGYVEPFTGEGMGLAILSARHAADLLPAPGADWPKNLPAQWKALHEATIVRRQRWSRLLRPMMRRPALVSAAIALARAAPASARFIADQIGRMPVNEVAS